jgi:hypothetical protein
MMIPDVEDNAIPFAVFGYRACWPATLVVYMLSFKNACVRPAVHAHRAGLLLLVAFTSAW